MVLRCDLLVIGLGPGGGAAAAQAARHGLSVVAVEKKKQVGMPVQCAEFIPLPLGRHAQGPGVLQQRIEGMRSILPSGAVTRTEFPGLMVDRAAFDQALARNAESAGAKLLLGAHLRRLDAAGRRALVETSGGMLEVSYRLLVAADGPRSFVAESLGLPRLPVVHTRQYTVPLHEPYADTDIWLSAAYPGGYAWLFPKGRMANLGLGMDMRFASDLRTPLDRLHRRLAGTGLIGETICCRTGGAIPVGGLRERLVVGAVLFVGDAAGLTHPVTGAGIAAAVVSGERAGEAAAAHLQGGRDNALADFEDDIRDQYEASLARAVGRRRWLEQQWTTPAAMRDATHRRGWIAFSEYFSMQ